jgi:stalled ribosome rescue protein Dom34
MGAYHTIDLEVNRKFTLSKAEWDSIALERVDQACDPTQVNLLSGSVYYFVLEVKEEFI